LRGALRRNEEGTNAVSTGSDNTNGRKALLVFTFCFSFIVARSFRFGITNNMMKVSFCGIYCVAAKKSKKKQRESKKICRK
jgi:hypothetical protein